MHDSVESSSLHQTNCSDKSIISEFQADGTTTTSTPIKTSEMHETEDLEKTKEDVANQQSKRKLEEPLNSTLKTLRRKKVKINNDIRREKEAQLDSVKREIRAIIERTPKEQLFTKTGTKTIQPFTKAKVACLFSAKEIRKILDDIFME